MFMSKLPPKAECNDETIMSGFNDHNLKMSCDSCVKAKRRCDGMRPICSQCKRTKKPNLPCHYSIRKKPGRKRKHDDSGVSAKHAQVCKDSATSPEKKNRILCPESTQFKPENLPLKNDSMVGVVSPQQHQIAPVTSSTWLPYPSIVQFPSGPTSSPGMNAYPYAFLSDPRSAYFSSFSDAFYSNYPQDLPSTVAFSIPPPAFAVPGFVPAQTLMMAPHSSATKNSFGDALHQGVGPPSINTMDSHNQPVTYMGLQDTYQQAKDKTDQQSVFGSQSRKPAAHQYVLDSSTKKLPEEGNSEVRNRKSRSGSGTAKSPPLAKGICYRSSCDNCVKSKKKCDGQRPACQNCKKAKGPQKTCTYAIRRKPGPKKKNAHKLVDIAHQLIELSRS